MEILDLRHLRSRDIEPLLEEEKSLWEKDLRWDYAPSAALIRHYIDASALPGYVAVEGGKAVGYSFYVYENSKGLIGDVFVSDTPCSEAAETQLLLHVIETLQAIPGILRIEAQLMNLRHQPPIVIRNGSNFQGFRRQFMVLPLETGPTLRSNSNTDFRLAGWDEQWVGQAAELITIAYQGHVDSQISDQYRSIPGAMRFLENIIHYPGCGNFDPDCSFVALGNGSPELCGMALSAKVGPGVSHITQVCVKPQMQGAGMGRALVCQIIQKLREHGFAAVTLTVTSSNTGAVRLYEKLGFSTLKEFHAFSWDAPAPASVVLGRG